MFIYLLFLDEWEKKKKEPCVLRPPSRSAIGLYSASGLALWHASCTLSAAMPSVAVFTRISYSKVLLWLPGQPRGLVPGRSGGSLGLLRYSSWLRSAPADLPRTGRRSQLCGGASPGPEWVLLPRCPAMRQSSSGVRASAPLSFGQPARSPDSLCSGNSGSTSGKMSSSFSFSSSSTSSSSANDGQGKPKPKSPFRKRGSLQSCTSPGECG